MRRSHWALIAVALGAGPLACSSAADPESPTLDAFATPDEDGLVPEDGLAQPDVQKPDDVPESPDTQVTPVAPLEQWFHSGTVAMEGATATGARLHLTATLGLPWAPRRLSGGGYSLIVRSSPVVHVDTEESQ